MDEINAVAAVFASLQSAERAVSGLQSKYPQLRVSIVGSDFQSERKLAELFAGQPRSLHSGAFGAFWVAGPLAGTFGPQMRDWPARAGVMALRSALEHIGIPEPSRTSAAAGP